MMIPRFNAVCHDSFTRGLPCIPCMRYHCLVRGQRRHLHVVGGPDDGPRPDDEVLTSHCPDFADLDSAEADVAQVKVVLTEHCWGRVVLLDARARVAYVSLQFDAATQHRALHEALRRWRARMAQLAPHTA